MARFEFTMVSDATMQGLLESGATGNEIIAYQMLVRGLPKDRSNAECWMPADMAEVKVGMRADVFTRALRGLCGKTVTATDGQRAPILTKLTRGCKGHCPHYEDTLGRLIAEGAYPPRNGVQACPAIKEANARQKQTPIEEFSTNDCKAKTTQLQGKNDPIARQGRTPIETRQDKHIVAAAEPTAQRSCGVSRPTSENHDSSLLGTREDPPRAPAGAAHGRTAAALPSRADEERYNQLLRTLMDQVANGVDYADALTPTEREEFQAISCRRAQGLAHE